MTDAGRSRMLNEDAQDEVLASIQQGLPNYLSTDEQREVAVAVLESLRRNRIVVEPRWMTDDSSVAAYEDAERRTYEGLIGPTDDASSQKR